MPAIRKTGDDWPGASASQSGDDEAEDSIVVDYGAITITYAELEQLLRLENRKDEEGAGQIGEEVEALLAAFADTGLADEFSFKSLQVTPPADKSPVPRETVTLTFGKIERIYAEGDDRDEAVRFAAELEQVLEQALDRDLQVRVTGGGEAGLIIKMDDVLISSYQTGGSGGDDRGSLTDLADYDLLG